MTLVNRRNRHLPEAALRGDCDAVTLLLSWRAEVNGVARGSDFPLIIAITRQQEHMVQILLEARADPTVKSYLPTRSRAGIPSWTGRTAMQMAAPGSTVALLVENSIYEWNGTAASTAQECD